MTREPACAICGGTGFKDVERDGPRWVTYCDCFLAARAQRRLRASGIQKYFTHCTFENYVAYNESLMQALDIAKGIAERFPELPRREGDTTGRGLVFMGPAGVGKTHLAVAILKRIIDRTHAWGVIYKTRDLLELIRQSYNPTIQTTAEQVLAPVLKCDLLVLDDLGAERLTDWVADTMDRIIDTRYSECRPVIVTTNFLNLKDDQDPNGFAWRVGFRSRSRLDKMCEFITMDGADYRGVVEVGEDALVKLWQERKRVDPTRTYRSGRQARAHLPSPGDGKADLKWPGGRGGNV